MEMFTRNQRLKTDKDSASVLPWQKVGGTKKKNEFQVDTPFNILLFVIATQKNLSKQVRALGYGKFLFSSTMDFQNWLLTTKMSQANLFNT